MEFTQFAINGVLSASVFSLVAIGLSIVYRVAGFLDFSHAALFVIAPYAAYCSITWFGAPLWLAAIVGVMSSAAIGSLLASAYTPHSGEGAARGSRSALLRSGSTSSFAMSYRWPLVMTSKAFAPGRRLRD